MKLVTHLKVYAIAFVLISISVLLPAESARASTNEFTVINKTGSPVYVAYGYHVPYSSSSGSSGYRLMVVTPEHWIATGWFKVAPYSSRDIVNTSSSKMYFRLESNGNTITPRNYEHSANFCIHSTKAFFSKEYVESDRFEVQYDKQGGTYQNYRSGSSCSSANGQWHKFFKMNVHMTFTVN